MQKRTHRLAIVTAALFMAACIPTSTRVPPQIADQLSQFRRGHQSGSSCRMRRTS